MVHTRHRIADSLLLDTRHRIANKLLLDSKRWITRVQCKARIHVGGPPGYLYTNKFAPFAFIWQQRIIVLVNDIDDLIYYIFFFII